MGRAAAKPAVEHPDAQNLYNFIRAVIGKEVSDNSIARRWEVDPRVFNDLKHGRIGVPRIERLKQLAKVLGVNEHFIYSAAAGVPVNKLLALVKRQDLSAAFGLLVDATARATDRVTQAQEALADSRKQLQAVTSELELRNAQLQTLVEQLLVGVLTLDVNGNILHINQIGRDLFGVEKVHPGVPMTVAISGTVFLDLDGRPFDATQLPSYQALRNRKASRGVFSIHRPGNKGRLVAATATPMRAGRRFIGVVSVVRDIEDILGAVGGLGIDMPLHPRSPRPDGLPKLALHPRRSSRV